MSLDVLPYNPDLATFISIFALVYAQINSYSILQKILHNQKVEILNTAIPTTVTMATISLYFIAGAESPT